MNCCFGKIPGQTSQIWFLGQEYLVQRVQPVKELQAEPTAADKTVLKAYKRPDLQASSGCGGPRRFGCGNQLNPRSVPVWVMSELEYQLNQAQFLQ